MSHFAKRHYEKIALAIQYADIDQTAANRIIAELCDVFAADNSRFNRERFAAACYPGANPGASHWTPAVSRAYGEHMRRNRPNAKVLKFPERRKP